MARRQAFFSIKTQFDNVGDALINRELIRLVARHAETAVDLSRCPVEFRTTLGLMPSNNVKLVRGTFRLFLSLLRARLTGGEVYYFLSPGGYSGEVSLPRLFSAWINTAILYGLNAIGVRVCHLGPSYERIGPTFLRILRARSKILHRHVVRDWASFSLLTELGVQVHGRMPDLAFGSVPSIPPATTKRQAIALSFRTDQYPDQKAQCEKIALHVDRIMPVTIPIKVVSQVGRDTPFAKRIYSRLLESGRPVTLLETSADILGCYNAYRDCRVVISNRLHALLIGSMSGASPIAIVDPDHNAKVIGLFEDCDLSSNIISVRDMRINETLEILLRCDDELPSINGAVQYLELDRAIRAVFVESKCEEPTAIVAGNSNLGDMQL